MLLVTVTEKLSVFATTVVTLHVLESQQLLAVAVLTKRHLTSSKQHLAAAVVPVVEAK